MSSKTALIVHWHPSTLSFNHACYKKAIDGLKEAGYDVITSDLREMNFNPISNEANFKELTELTPEGGFKQQMEEIAIYKSGSRDRYADDVRGEIEKLLKADLVVFVQPLWWFSVPAMIKGWMDRVLTMGNSYGMGKLYDQGGNKGKRGMFFFTAGSLEPWYSESGLHGPIDKVLWHLHLGSMWFTGFDVLPHYFIGGPARMSEDDRSKALEEWGAYCKNIDNVKPLDREAHGIVNMADVKDGMRTKSV
eukprot:TRINITY_DN11353_c0_g1_i1.p1 TRINITY_DN11353_c0_g1~~TRINITY_DN11353_c0_g1_i1.p1  ORF type:complete len:249 (+),score=69.11 TRINITY_DN11353_c0_g1_i1:59-805(+)